LADIPDLPKTLVGRLGIFVTELDERVKPILQVTRSDSGIVVVAQSAGPNAVDTGLQAEDIIRAINGTPLQSISQFRALVRNLKAGHPIVLQVERKRKLQYLAFEME
jgi:S1-C subfamily serine protease